MRKLIFVALLTAAPFFALLWQLARRGVRLEGWLCL